MCVRVRVFVCVKKFFALIQPDFLLTYSQGSLTCDAKHWNLSDVRNICEQWLCFVVVYSILLTNAMVNPTIL
jgi:hypothetical protein